MSSTKHCTVKDRSSHLALSVTIGDKRGMHPSKKQTIPEKYKKWIEARRRFKLTHAQIQMARELGLNPKKFGSLANNKQEPWKLSLTHT
jgi:hypothetical protein